MEPIAAKRLALATLLAPILFMASLVQSAILLISGDASTTSGLLYFWLLSHCFITAIFFLISLREKSILFDSASSDTPGFKRTEITTALGAVWGISAAFAGPLADASFQYSFGAILAGFTFTGALLLKHLTRLALAILTPVVLGFLANIYVQADVLASIISIVVLTYFSVVAICTRWYFARYAKNFDIAAKADEHARNLIGMLEDLSDAATGFFWRTDESGYLKEQPASPAGIVLKTRFAEDSPFFENFSATPDRKELSARMERRSELLGLELQHAGDEEAKWFRVAGKPVFENGAFKGFRGALTDISDAKENERRIAELSETDHLTGLPNRARLHNELERLIHNPPKSDVLRALIWLDLDNFKWVNDTLGHPAGDELLKSVADRLRAACDEGDIIARMGGDEFAIIVERADGDALAAFATALTETLAVPYSLWGSTARCSASVGVRRLDASTRDSLTLFKHADLALYQSKDKGKSQWTEFTQDLDTKARARVQLEEELRLAVDNGELQLYFQPIVDAVQMRTVGVEALLRWLHPVRGTIYPGEFIGLAEDCGLITRIGDLVIRNAVRAASQLPNDIQVAINVSPIQMHSTSLIDTIREVLDKYDVDASRLELEITESVLMSDTEFVLKRLGELKDIGLRIALDDFGTGFSSLAYLRQFPFDKIKLDKSFVCDLETSDESRAIATATLTLATSLGLRSTAEGVETAFQRDFLRREGCDELQGFFVSRAKPENELAQFITVFDDESSKQRRASLQVLSSSNVSKAG